MTLPTVTKPLTPAESGRLDKLEAVVERGVSSFIEVGRALAEIRDSTLYRQTHATFEAYCRERWDLSRPRAYQLVEAAEAAGRLSTTVDKPSSEGQVRPLTRLPAEQQAKAWETAIKAATSDGADRPTARHVEAAVREILQPTVEPATKKEPESERPKGVGLMRANEAINALSRIPKDDPFRKRGLQMVADWIKHNH